MNAAQALLHQIRLDTYAWAHIGHDLREAIKEELEKADTTPDHLWAAGPVTGEQTHRRLGLIRDPQPPPA